MASAFPVPKIPSVTFLCGGSPDLRTEVATILSDAVYATQLWSFASPVHEATLGCFFSGDPAINIASLADHPIFPSNGSPTFGAFVAAFSQFLPSFFADPSIMGRLAIRRLEENRQYFDHFIFDDADTKENIRLVADLFGRPNCLIVNFGDPYLTSSSIPVLDLPRSLPLNPTSIIEYLSHRLNPAPPSQPPVVIASPLPTPTRIDINDLL